MICQCCKYFHRTTAMALVDDQLELTVTNNTGVSSSDRFCLVVCQDPNKVSTSPVDVVVTVNEETIPIYTKYSTPLNSSMLGFYTHRILRGYYVINGDSTYVILPGIPYNNYCGCCNAQNATTATTSTTTSPTTTPTTEGTNG